MSFVSTWPKTKTAIQISFVSTGQKSGLLFSRPLFLPSLRPRLLFRYPLFLLGKFKNCCSDILYSYLTLIRIAIQISSVSTRPMSKTVIQISFVFTLQLLGLLFRYPLFLPTLLGTAIQISSVSTQPKSKAVVKTSVST